MRQRRAKNLEEKIEALAVYRVDDPTALAGKWRSLFQEDGPVYLEIGCGKGQFAMRQALLHPERNYVAVEGQISVALRAMEKAEEVEKQCGQRRLRIVCEFVQDLGEMFAEGELAGIYLNFSDPWPKDRHFKRRLTYRERLRSYEKALCPGGFIELKTDNDAHFAFTLEEIEACGFAIAARADDLHAESASSQNSGEAAEKIREASQVTTEYEDKFRAQGLPIHFVRIEKE